ncbi:MAG: hypothetical protein KF779_02580 [Hyphomonadaceae bacterium]|nr:hypothetical protein [Hyphomonadaceae bacterium]
MAQFVGFGSMALFLANLFLPKKERYAMSEWINEKRCRFSVDLRAPDASHDCSNLEPHQLEMPTMWGSCFPIPLETVALAKAADLPSLPTLRPVRTKSFQGDFLLSARNRPNGKFPENRDAT